MEAGGGQTFRTANIKTIFDRQNRHALTGGFVFYLLESYLLLKGWYE